MTNLTKLSQFLKNLPSAAVIGDAHHKYGKIGPKHELIDRLQS